MSTGGSSIEVPASLRSDGVRDHPGFSAAMAGRSGHVKIMEASDFRLCSRLEILGPPVFSDSLERRPSRKMLHLQAAKTGAPKAVNELIPYRQPQSPPLSAVRRKAAVTCSLRPCRGGQLQRS